VARQHEHHADVDAFEPAAKALGLLRLFTGAQQNGHLQLLYALHPEKQFHLPAGGKFDLEFTQWRKDLAGGASLAIVQQMHGHSAAPFIDVDLVEFGMRDPENDRTITRKCWNDRPQPEGRTCATEVGHLKFRSIVAFGEISFHRAKPAIGILKYAEVAADRGIEPLFVQAVAFRESWHYPDRDDQKGENAPGPQHRASYA